MRVGIISGSGVYTLPGLEDGEQCTLATPFGEAEVVRASYRGLQVLYIARHGAGHVALSSSVNHRAQIWALRELGASCVISLTACGAVDPSLELGSLVIFDDLHFISNRLPDGALCTFFTEPGDPARGHWVLDDGPYSTELREILTNAALAAEVSFQSGGVYGHVDGPRFNTPVEIAQLAAAGVAAVSQTGGPETVLCGELELPLALVGFVTDFANGVRPEAPTPINLLAELLARAPDLFARLLAQALPRLATLERPPAAAGTMLRLGFP